VNVTPPPTLSHALGLETKELHRKAERTGAMNALLKGRMPLEGYVLLLRNLHPIYERLESAFGRVTTVPLLAWLDRSAVLRADRIAADLGALHGSGWEDLEVMPAARRHVAALETLESTCPHGLVGHAWVRYMGDVSGGQILARLLARQFELDGSRGLTFYDFEDLGDLDAFKTDFRDRLDLMSEEHHERLIEEARLGFEHAIRLFDQLEDRVPPGDAPDAA
jgi:heme oxygenase